MKHLFCSFLTMLFVIAFQAGAQSYDFAEKNSDGVTIYYKNLPDGTLEVTCKEFEEKVYKQEASYNNTVNIPNKVRGKKVSRIGDQAFYTCKELVCVNIPNSVISIGKNAFQHCDVLTTVNIPQSVTSIGTSAFSGCISLTSLTIPNSVTSIGEDAFSACIHANQQWCCYWSHLPNGIPPSPQA